MSEEKEFHVTATTTIVATFLVYAESEEEAQEIVADAAPTGPHAFDYTVNDAIEVSDDGWDVATVAATKP